MIARLIASLIAAGALLLTGPLPAQGRNVPTPNPLVRRAPRPSPAADPQVRDARVRDTTPRTAVIAAFEPEWTVLKGEMEGVAETEINGVRFLTGRLAGKPVLLFLSGVSMVNAAMTTQLALDRFTVSRIVFTGIAGGIDPALDVGDVVVPDQWAQYLESTFARASGAGFAPPEGDYTIPGIASYGMMHPRRVTVRRAGNPAGERKLWFEADPGLLETARKAAATVALRRCVADLCLVKPPRVVVGGRGISGPVFMDNAEYRKYAFAQFKAQVLDMETAAVAQVAYANGVPFVGFRSLSDLAGGDPQENQMFVFFRVAAANSAALVTAFLKALP